MGLDSLFERLVIAAERIATALESGEKPCTVPPIVTPEPEAPKRTHKSGGDKVKAEEPNLGTEQPNLGTQAAVAAPAPVVQKNFLDEDEETAPAAPVLTEKERRDRIRKGLQKLQTVTTPEFALTLLKETGKVEMLRDLTVDKFDAMDAAISKATLKAAA